MQHSSSVVQLIQKRSSWRAYESKPVENHLRTQLDQFIKAQTPSPWKDQARFEIMVLNEVVEMGKQKFGTYGFIKGAKTFIVGAAKQSTYHLENFGYLLEEIILFATSLDLATCWLGGTFTRSSFANYLNLNKDETIPAIATVGYPTSKRITRDIVIRRIAKSNKRKPWFNLFFEDDINHPLMPNEAGIYTTPLEMVRIAPSASNSQPWRIIKEKQNDIFHFFIHRKNKWKISSIFDWPDFSRIDLGIAVCHFDLSLKEMGVVGYWNIEKPGISYPPNFDYEISWCGK